jgi:hypothetical protein
VGVVSPELIGAKASSPSTGLQRAVSSFAVAVPAVLLPEAADIDIFSGGEDAQRIMVSLYYRKSLLYFLTLSFIVHR